MVIQIFVLHFCPVMLSSSCANSSAKSVSNDSMPNARPSIQPETMLISRKKGQHTQFQPRLQIGDDLFFVLEITPAIMVRKLRNLPASA